MGTQSSTPAGQPVNGISRGLRRQQPDMRHVLGFQLVGYLRAEGVTRSANGKPMYRRSMWEEDEVEDEEVRIQMQLSALGDF